MSLRLSIGLLPAMQLPRVHAAGSMKRLIISSPARPPSLSLLPHTMPRLAALHTSTRPLDLSPVQSSRHLFFPRPTPHRSPLPLVTAFSARPFSSSSRALFRQTSRALIRNTYFPKSGGGYGGPPPRGSGGWFRDFRRRIDRLPVMTIIYGIIGLNVAVFLLWQYAISSWQRFRDPELYQFMMKNFVLNEPNIMAGRLWTLITSSFSHSGGQHILVNCLGLYFVAPAAASLVGSSAFLGLYLGGGLFAALTSLAWNRYRGNRTAGSEGASGAIYASLAFYGALFPNTTFLLFFIVPMPAWLLVGGIFAYDAYSAVYRPYSGTDSAGHMGGILAGLVAALAVRRRGPGAIRRW